MNTEEQRAESKALEQKPENPDKQHFDKMLLKELVWKLDREVWAHVQNPSPFEEWSTSKAREETRNLISEYIGSYDAIKEENQRLTEEAKRFPFHEIKVEMERLTKINEELVKALSKISIGVSDKGPRVIAAEAIEQYKRSVTPKSEIE